MDPATSGRASAVFATGTDPVQMRAILEQHLQVPGSAPFEVVRCNPTFTRGRGPRSLFQYDVTLRDPDGREWNEVVSGVSYGGQRTRKAWMKLKFADATRGREQVILPAAYVPDLDLLLQVFPFDHELPALAPLMTGTLPGLQAPILARFGPGDWRLDEWHSESVRYRVDLRASVKLTIRANEIESGCACERRFFAKVYAGGERVERAWAVQQELGIALRDASEPIGLAPVVVCLPEDRVLVQDEVQGLSLPKVLESDDAETAEDAVRRAARAIAALHRLTIEAPKHRIELDRTDPERMRRSAETLRNSRPDLAPAVAEIEAGILESLAAIGELPSVPVHGDLKLAHLLFDDDRVVLLDLDKFAAGEPMLDVVSMLMPLRRQQRTRFGDNSLARAFTEEYFAHVPAEWRQRLAPHFAWGLVREAAGFGNGQGEGKAKARSSRREKRENHVELLLEEARAVLAGRA